MTVEDFTSWGKIKDGDRINIATVPLTRGDMWFYEKKLKEFTKERKPELQYFCWECGRKFTGFLHREPTSCPLCCRADWHHRPRESTFYSLTFYWRQDEVNKYNKKVIGDLVTFHHPDTKTQENRRAPGYEERQEEIELNGQMVWADPELIPLLKALNDIGLITRSHCAGHESDEAFVVIRMDSITGIDIRTRGEYNEVCLQWNWGGAHHG